MYIGKTRTPITVILLSIITCGIYSYFIYFSASEDINLITGQKRINTGMMLLLSILCPFVLWVWLYQIDKNLVEIGEHENTHYRTSKFVLWLLLTFVFGVGAFVALYQMQDGLNAVWDNRRKLQQ